MSTGYTPVQTFTSFLSQSPGLSYLAYVSLDILCLGVSHGVVKSRQAYPEPIEAIVRTIDCEDWRPGVGLRHPPVSLQDDDLGPDLVID